LLLESKPVKITFYLDVTSSWCFWAEPAWAELKRRYAGRAEFAWKLALMDASGLPTSRAQCEWYYRRSGTLVGSPYMLDAGWFEGGHTEYLAPNLIAEAAKDFGVKDDLVRLVLSHAALREGRPIARWEVSASIAAAAAGLEVEPLLRAAQSKEILIRARESTAEFHTFGATQRPLFLIENSIGDRAMFSGIANVTPLIAAIDALAADQSALTAYTAHHGHPPSA
jgi:predicted DsbA family dithiol-disulfide isomerase